MKLILAMIASLLLLSAPTFAQEVVTVAKPKKLKTIVPDDREDYLENVQLWRPTNIESMDVLGGPGGDGSFKFDQLLECEFNATGVDASGGASRKYECKDQNQTKHKVKYTVTNYDLDLYKKAGLPEQDRLVINGQTNKEVYAEVAATRLFWALGFYNDDMYPIQAKCHNCPLDPMLGHATVLKYPFTFSTRYAAVERRLEAVELAEKPDQGWTWEEMEKEIGDYPAAGEPANHRTHFEALKLLAVFIQHGDRKAEQQRLVCPPSQLRSTDLTPDEEGVIYESKDEPLCAQPIGFVHDLGATFGGAGFKSSENGAKMNLQHWAKKRIFDEYLYNLTARKRKGVRSGICKANMVISLAAVNGQQDPIISEYGRAFLGDLLNRFRKAGKVKDLFKAARVQGLGYTVESWEKTFNDKVNQILEHKCCIPNYNNTKCAGD